MTTATTSQNRAYREYRHSLRFAVVSLSYFVDGDGQHVVSRSFVADHPNVYRFDTAEEAQAKWFRLHDELTRTDYVPVK